MKEKNIYIYFTSNNFEVYFDSFVYPRATHA